MWNFYTKIKGALGIWTDNNLMKDVARERFGEDTGNSVAKQIATELGKMYDDLRVRFNAAGGDIVIWEMILDLILFGRGIN